VLEAFAPQESMRAYGRGIRRRLAPMLGGDHRRVAMAHALLLSPPGTPVLLYGDEIGMGEDLSRPERLAVRTPMQWSDDVNAGFSSAPEGQLAAPVIHEGPFAYPRVNVYDQTLDPESLLARVGNMVRTRLGMPELGLGACRPLHVDRSCVLALRHDHEGTTCVTLVNLSPEAVEVHLGEKDLPELVDILADQRYPRAHGATPALRLGGYGYRWLRPRNQVLR
jgi:maltose alpha-D-glucosyltransferase/alpha-amylase